MGENICTIDFTVSAAEDGKSCGDFLRGRGVSRRLIVRLKRVSGGITRGGVTVRTVDIVRTGEVISLRSGDGSPLVPNGELRADVVYEDGDVAVFNKPANMPVHPSAGHRFDTLGNLFAAMYPSLTFRPVNRLDKDTSGLCAVARNPYAAAVLSGNISKVYYAVTEGEPIPRKIDNPLVKWYERDGRFVIDAPIGRVAESVVLRQVRAEGRSAVTEYTIVKRNGKHCLVKIWLQTGRTHQIRVHFSALGHPLAGDDLYGGSLEYCSEQALHCGEMSFRRVSDGETVNLSCPLREDMAGLFEL